jgi:hypothetical protein
MIESNKLPFKAVVFGCLLILFNKICICQKVSIKHQDKTVCTFEISQNKLKNKSCSFNINMYNKKIKVKGGLTYKDLIFKIPKNDTIVYFQSTINKLEEVSLDSQINYIVDKKKNSRKHILKAGLDYGIYLEIPKKNDEITINNLILYPKKVLSNHGFLKINFYQKIKNKYKKMNNSDIVYPLKYFKNQREVKLNILKKTAATLSDDFILSIKVVKKISDHQEMQLSEPMLKLKCTKDERKFFIRFKKEYGWLEQENVNSFGLKLGYK